MNEIAKEKHRNKVIALLVVFAMLFTQFASTVNSFATEEQLPFKTTATDPKGKECKIEKTGKTVKYDKWQMGDPDDIINIDLYVCKVPAGSDYVYLHRNGDNQIGNQKGEELWEDASIGEGKYYLSSISTGSLLGEKNFIVIKEKPTNATYYALYFEEESASAEGEKPVALPFKSTVTNSDAVPYPIELTDKKLGDRYGTYTTYKCVVPNGTKSVTLNTAKKENFFEGENIVTGAYNLEGKIGESKNLVISVGSNYYALYFEEAAASAELPFKTTITDIDDDTELYEISATGEKVTTAFNMELPLYVCKVPAKTDTVNLHKNGDFKYLHNTTNTVDFPEGWYTIKEKMGKENFFIIESEMTGKNIDFALYFEVDPSLKSDVADKTELRAAVVNAEEIIRNAKLYDAEDVKTLKTSVEEAHKILKNKDNTQTQVNNKLKELNGQIKAVKSNYYVYFETKEGDRIDSVDGVFTLSALNEGKFKVAGKNVTKVNWDCVEKVTEEGEGSNTESYFKFWINEDGTYQPKEPKTVNATVTFLADGQEAKRTFKINTVATDIKAIKVYSGNKEVTENSPLVLKGREWATITAKGLVDNKWIDIPAQSFYIAPQKNIHVQGNRMALWEKDKNFKITVSLYGDQVKTTFTAKSEYVPVKSFEIKLPKTTWILDEWNPSSNSYLGLRYYADPASDKGFHIDMNPKNATNWDMEWESSDTDVAYFDPLNDNGIVPKKAGKVEFTVKSKDNPKATDKIALEFKYKNPLKAATAPYDTEDKKLTIGANEIKEFEMTTNPENATERRFKWSYSKDGIVEVSDKLEYVSFGEQEENQGNKIGELKVTHLIKGKSLAKDETVIVTGTPVDDTANCKPVKFAVTVKADEGFKPVAGRVNEYREIYNDSAAVYAKNLMSYGNEWSLIGLTRGGASVNKDTLDKYYQSVLKKVTDTKGNLSNSKYTEYSRVILGLTAAGFDPENVGGYNLVAKLGDFDKVTAQGINGPIWALLALDSKDYKLPENATTTRDKLIDAILDAEDVNGGWSFGGEGASVDITAMAIQALAPYYESDNDVKAAVDRALEILSENQTMTGAFKNDGGSETSESTAQVIIALTSLGINPETDQRFIKNGKTAMDGLMEFYAGEGQFKHVKSGDKNAMATEQSFDALAAYLRLCDNKTSLYNMSDVAKNDVVAGTTTVTPVKPSAGINTADKNAADKADKKDTPKTGDNANMIPWIILLLGAASATAVVRRKEN